ncbi:Proteasome subunit beta type-7 [Thelohanellus kitauei]|uniref:Proteasome subunit beta type-7 n=1 Tax=Thelohanellus kitauei TaxID=669202 RepID=A0A0C2J0E7_THEKT|nr:Proteasome subunit beta type-7 [Thelohanellus kitauei]
MEECGFCFDNCRRNELLVANEHYKLPAPKKTGTTIAGAVFKDGVIIGADTRSTSETVVEEKNCLKLHRLTDYIYAAGAGSSADLLKVTDMLAQRLRLLELNSGRKPRVVTAVTMAKRYLFNYKGYVSAYLIIGGVDVTGSHLYSISSHGHSDHVPFVTNGSGCLAAISHFEQFYRSDMDLESAKHYVSMAVSSGILNDLGSGSNVDLAIITPRGVDFLRNYQKISVPDPLLRKYNFKKGTTKVTKQGFKMMPYDVVYTVTT